ALKKLGRYYDGALLVTGTNGKTTTARLIGNILKEAKIAYIHNREGSNLLRGLIGALAENVTLSNKTKKLALLETDELTIPAATNSIEPRAIVFNNLFRDQLDRYGEVDKIRKIWQKALLQLDPATTLVLNSDDHSVAHLGSSSKARVIYFGIEDDTFSLKKLPHASDFTNCIACGGQLRFDRVYLSHLGKYKCATCGLKRPKPDIYAENILLDEENGFSAKVATPKGSFDLKIGLPGIYNVYNSLAAVSAALALNINLTTIKKGLEGSPAAFGRTEKINLDGKKLFLGLVKNPSGFNEILRLLLSGHNDKYLLIIINDLIADGRDVSWLWDVDFEELFSKKEVRRIRVAGTRAADMALRLKYASTKAVPRIEENLEQALEVSIEEVPKGETLYVLPTYTALLSLKKILAEKGFGKPFWED
ncbi:MAG TPA: MurT ligase domain-containing protein, partial [Candidatus Nanoarchaeia archaeon]